MRRKQNKDEALVTRPGVLPPIIYGARLAEYKIRATSSNFYPLFPRLHTRRYLV
jgi:hypothetical protein